MVSSHLRQTVSRATLNSQDLQNENECKSPYQIGHVKYDSLPRAPLQGQARPRPSPADAVCQDYPFNDSKVKGKKQRDQDKEGTVSSGSQGESYLRPNINERLQRTSGLAE